MIFFNRGKNNDDRKQDNNSDLFKERMRSPVEAYRAEGRIPIRRDYAVYTLVCTRLQPLRPPPIDANVPRLGLPGNIEAKPLISDSTDAETWSRLLSQPPTHFIELRYETLKTGVTRYLLRRNLNFRLDYYSGDEATNWTAQKICKHIERMLLNPPELFRSPNFYIHSVDTLMVGFWLVVIQRKFRELWIEDQKIMYLSGYKPPH